jgi:hypothetical protein
MDEPGGCQEEPRGRPEEPGGSLGAAQPADFAALSPALWQLPPIVLSLTALHGAASLLQKVLPAGCWPPTGLSTRCSY